MKKTFILTIAAFAFASAAFAQTEAKDSGTSSRAE